VRPSRSRGPSRSNWWRPRFIGPSDGADVGGRIDIVIERWSTDAEREALLRELRTERSGDAAPRPRQGVSSQRRRAAAAPTPSARVRICDACAT
jgi:hypothetical protein